MAGRGGPKPRPERPTTGRAAYGELAAILVAAGKSVRFGRDKLLESLGGRPVIAWPVETFLRRADVACVVVVTPADDDRAAQQLRDALPADARLRYTRGGVTRAHSVRNGARAVPESIEWLAIHDAARPLVSPELIDRTLDAAVRHGAAVPALPVPTTIKEVDGWSVVRTLPRRSLWAAQTPQIMRRTALLEAFERCPLPFDQITDDVQLLELAGAAVRLVEGEPRNLKLTEPVDLELARLWLNGR
jgi:2-C-methyl-D-erythritol 4-phosphate cytidylyltransferase